MDVYEITRLTTGLSETGVNYLEPGDSYQNLRNGFIYRQILQSRKGIVPFCPRLDNESRVFGIFEFIKPDDTAESLVFDRNFLYKYDTTLGVYVQIPFAGSMLAYTGFNISANNFYVSGTAYPGKANNPRFVFTSQGFAPSGGSQIFFYDGTSVLNYTDTTDNPDYAAPIDGPLTAAKFILWFNGRINFVVPTIAGIQYNQTTLFSAIANSGGSGDKFNISGSGTVVLDTNDPIRGAKILGQVIALSAFRSNWSLEKTADAFNPYFSRKIPGPLGTDANFSGVEWAEVVKTMGRTGILSSDARRVLRIDNKIPNFTKNEVNQVNFDLIYGGFDRTNNQFLWSYLSNESEGLTQDKVLIQNYEEDTWAIYDLRLTVFGQTDLGINLTWDDIDETSGNEAWAQWDTTEELWDLIGLGESVQKTLAGDDLGYIYELNADNDDYFSNITGITNAPQAVLTVTPSGFQVGDFVTVENVQGMTEINNYISDPEADNTTFTPWQIVAVTATTITLNVDSTLFGVYTAGGSISKPIDFYAKTIPFNPYRSDGRKCYVSMVEVLIDSNGGDLKMDIFQDEEEAPFKFDVPLIPAKDSTKKRQWIEVVVNNEANFLTFAFKQFSPGAQVKVTNFRIHCEPGGLTSG